MNVLGVVFDSKLTWSEQVAHAMKKSNKSLCALRKLNFFFQTQQDENFINQ